MLASACASEAPTQDDASPASGAVDSTDEASQAASSDELLRVGVAGLPKLFVPSGSTSAEEQQMVEHVFDGLVQLDKETMASVEPALAKSWEISEDGRSYTFELRDDVVFSDGTPFDAEAVKLNFERLTDPDSPYYWEVGASVAASQVYGDVAGFEVTGPHSVVFHLNKPNPDWLLDLCETFGRFVSPTVIKEKAPDEVTQSPIGTGPFLIDNRDPSAITFKRNPTYWGPEPSLPGFIVRGYVENATRVAALESGEVDFILSVRSDDVQAADKDRFKPFTLDAQIPWIVRFNTRHEAMEDIRVRRALNYAVDREAIAEGLFAGLAQPMTQPLPPGNIGYNPDQEGYEYDPERAKQLLAEAGYADGLSIKALFPADGLLQLPAISQAIQADLREVGVDLEYDTLEWTSYLDAIRAGVPEEYAMASTEWWAPTLAWLRQQVGTDGFPPDGSNLGFYSNPEADQLMDDADAVGVEPEERKRLYQEAQSHMVEDPAWLFLITRPETGLSTHGLSGVRSALSGFDLSAATFDGDR